MNKKEVIRDSVRKNYSEIALQGASGGGCCSGGCCCGQGAVDIKETSFQIGYSEEDVDGMVDEANLGLGCGNPIAIASLKEGETVLDLGSGGGFDCFLARKQVGEEGYVIGVDMTAEMITLARRNVEKFEYKNVVFRLGEIEHLPVADETVDVILSNCVINLSPEKEQVFKEAYRVLKPGGRLSISDVVATVRLPEDVRQDLQLVSGCIGGAEYVDDIRRMLELAGFHNIRMSPKENSREIVKSWAPDRNMEDFVASYLIEAVKKDVKAETTRSCCSTQSNCCC